MGFDMQRPRPLVELMHAVDLGQLETYLMLGSRPYLIGQGLPKLSIYQRHDSARGFWCAAMVLAGGRLANVPAMVRSVV